MAVPVQSPAGRTAHATFTALLNSLSRPGTVQALPEGQPFELVAAALLDLEVSAYTPDKALQGVLTATGAPLKAAGEADYLFFPEWTADALSDIGHAKVGTATDPHRSSTIVLPAKFISDVQEGHKMEWRGPGIPEVLIVALHAMTAESLHELLTLRRENRFPVGWDIFFVDDSKVMALPRTTHVTEVN